MVTAFDYWAWEPIFAAGGAVGGAVVAVGLMVYLRRLSSAELREELGGVRLTVVWALAFAVTAGALFVPSMIAGDPESAQHPWALMVVMASAAIPLEVIGIALAASLIRREVGARPVGQPAIENIPAHD